MNEEEKEVVSEEEVAEPEIEVEAPSKKKPSAKKGEAKKPKAKKTEAKKTEAKKAKVKKAEVKKAETPKKRVSRLTPFQLQKQQAVKGHKRFNHVRAKYYVQVRNAVNKNQETLDLYTALANKKATITGITRNEVKKFHSEFIEEIEKVITSLETIVVSPHKFINEFAEVVQVEKARRITPRAVKHMAQNVQNISEVHEGGRVIPKKVLNVFVDDDVVIYENRFVMTLIKRLQVFIELRYKYIEEHGDTKNSDVFTIKKEATIGELNFEFEGTVKMSVPSEDEGNRQSNLDLLERLRSLRKRTSFLVNSTFMRDMSRAIPVGNPIQQTNIIRLNYAYQDAYKLWVFINRYDELGIAYTITQSKVDFTPEYLERLDQLTLSAFLALETDHTQLAPAGIKQRIIKPYVQAGQLDYDLSDERFYEAGLPVKVMGRAETAEQKEARLKREAAREKARQRRIDAKNKEKERQALLKARAKERAKLKKKSEAERARIRKLDAQERQKEKNLERDRKRREKERLVAERKIYQSKMQEEARKLREARLAISKLASGGPENGEQ